MGKLVAIQTFERFQSIWENNGINEHSLVFILDTGQLYTHGIFINSAAFGTVSNNTVALTIAGVTNTLSLSNHTHSTYLQKDADIDIGTHKIVSGNNDLLQYSNSNIYLGNDTDITYIKGSPKTYRDSTAYSILDTGNFSIKRQTSTGSPLSNVALFTYGNSTFQLDYIKRTNSSSTFDSLNSATQAGTTTVSGKQYGFITFYNEGAVNNPGWAQLRINITDGALEYRTSTASSTWISPQAQSNALNVAGIVAAPDNHTLNKVWKTDGSGNPAWRDNNSLSFQQLSGVDLCSYNTNSDKTILAGDNITFSYSENVLTVNSANTWKAANTSQEGYVPRLIAATDDTITTQNSEYVLVFKSGSETTPVWRKLPTNAFLNTWVANAVGVAGYVAAPTKADNANMVWKTDSDGVPAWRADSNDNSWRGIYVGGTSRVGTGINTLPINFTAGSNIFITFEGAGTSDGNSGSNDYFNIKIASTNTTYKLKLNNSNKGTTNGTDLGTFYAPTSAGTGFLKGTADGNGNITWSWDNSTYNNYSLPTASSSALGGVKTGAAITDVTGYTAVHIKDGVIYYKDTNTTYTFYNLVFRNGDTDVDTYKPTTTPSKTVKAGSNVQISASNNIITISATDTTYSTVSKTAAGLCPTLPNENTTEKFLRQDGTWVKPSYTAAANNGTFSIKSKIGNNDAVTLSDFTANQSSADDFTLIQGDNITFTNNTTNRTLIITGTPDTKYKLTLNGTAKGTSTGTDLGTFYAVATSDASAANQVWMRNSSNNGYAWRTLGSHAFDSTTYATPDATTTLQRAASNLAKDTWSDVGTFSDSVTAGTYVVNFIYDSIVYSGVFSYSASADTLNEEIALHAAGTGTKRLYARISGKKFQIASNEDTFSMAQTTFNFRKLL